MAENFWIGLLAFVCVLTAWFTGYVIYKLYEGQS
jgi:hypothetical protein